MQPPEVVLDTRRPPSGRVLILAHNPHAAPISSPRLSFILTTGISTDILEGPSPPYSGDLAWIVQVTGDQTAPSTAKLVALLTYEAPNATLPSESAVTGAVTFAAPAGIAALKATLLPAEGNVEADKPLDLILQIDNPGRLTAEITDIALQAPSYVTVAAPPTPQSIEPGGSKSIPLTIKAGAAIPGAYTLVVGYQAKFPAQSPDPLDGAATSKIDIQVPGVSDTLQLIGIPSLLLIPGALMVYTFVPLFAAFTRRTTVDPKQPYLLVVAVVLSFLAALIYPYATELVDHHRRDFLRGYELRDVIYLWAGSIAAGIVAAGLGAILFWILRYRSYRRAQREPKEDDNPEEVLRKLANNGSGFLLQAVRENQGQQGAQPENVLVLPFGQAGGGMRWVVPRASLSAGQGAGAAEHLAAIRRVLEVQTPTAADSRRLGELLQTEPRDRVVETWEQPGGPMKVAITKHPVGQGRQTLFFIAQAT